MAKGLFRERDPQLGPCAFMDWGLKPGVEGFIARDTYEANGHQPPFDELPTREQYAANHA
jgi:hypothetical protein